MRALAVIVVLGSLTLIPTASANSAAWAAEQLPTWTKGDYWRFAAEYPYSNQDLTLDLEVLAADENGFGFPSYRVRMEMQLPSYGTGYFQEIYVRKADLAWLGSKGAAQPTTPPGYILQFPIEVGRTWGDVVDSGYGKSWYNYTVRTQETIIVPAGQFNAYRIDYAVTTVYCYGSTCNSYTSESYFWYSGDVGWIICFAGYAPSTSPACTDTNWRLTAYHLQTRDFTSPASAYFWVIVGLVAAVVVVAAALALRRRKKKRQSAAVPSPFAGVSTPPSTGAYPQGNLQTQAAYPQHTPYQQPPAYPQAAYPQHTPYQQPPAYPQPQTPPHQYYQPPPPDMPLGGQQRSGAVEAALRRRKGY